MANIIEKDISELTKKNKPIKTYIKRTIIGVIISAITISFIPNAEYYITLAKSKNGSYIESVMSNDLSREKQVAEIFSHAIKNNDDIPEEQKEKIINSFTEYVIEEFGEYFTEDTIANMYAIASTEKVSEMSEFAKKHGWWTGDYNSYLNKYTLNDSVEDSKETLIAHEQLHAILKSGLFGTGLTTGINGYAINEGLTAFMVKKDNGYSEETIVANMLGLIIGYDQTISYYINGDLKGLKNELEKYLEREEVNQLIKNLDLNIFSNYLKTFLSKNNISYNMDKLDERVHQRSLIVKELMRKMFENKYNCKIENSKLGRVIFGEGSNYFDEEWNIEEPFYVIEYYNKEQVELSVLLYKNFDFYIDSYIININELEDVDVDKLLEDAIKNSKNQMK